MTQKNNFFEDLAKLSGSAMNAAFNSVADAKTQMEEFVSSKFDELLKKQNLVTREEFDIVKAMAEKARTEQEKLERRLKAIESGKVKKKTPTKEKSKDTKK